MKNPDPANGGRDPGRSLPPQPREQWSSAAAAHREKRHGPPREGSIGKRGRRLSAFSGSGAGAGGGRRGHGER